MERLGFDSWRGGACPKHSPEKDDYWFSHGEAIYGLRLNTSNTTNFEQYLPLLNNWGRTYGTPAGPNGKPLCESKLLDDSFWYYQGATKYLQPGIGTVATECDFYFFVYRQTSTGWNTWWWDGKANQSTGDANIATIKTLEPGCYFCRTRSCSNNANYEAVCSWFIDNQLLCIGGGKRGTNSWRGTNMLFFVDSPVSIQPSWVLSYGNSYTGCQFEAEIFRFTPPGYWKP